MHIKKSTDGNQDPVVKSHVEINLDRLCGGSSISTQALLAVRILELANRMTKTFERLGIIRGKLGLASIQFGFNSANQTATAGLFQLGGGAVLAGAGVAQGVVGCKSATELAAAVETRDSNLAKIHGRAIQGEKELSIEEGSDITIQVEALDEPVMSRLDEVEEEIFYDAEETLSSKQAKPEKRIEAQMEEKPNIQNKITEEKTDELIKKENKEYDVKKDLIKAKTGRFQGLGAIGQGIFPGIQSLGELEKAKSQKETVQKEVAQDNQNQLGNTADDLKKKADKIAEFDPFQRNSSSLRG